MEQTRFILLIRLCFLAVFIFLPHIVATQTLPSQKGNASYYADRFHGRKMANGDLYHRDSMTCAHLKYPLGTQLLVRNPANDREVVVTVTDRGPYTRKFVIDLSRAAARHLDIIPYGYRMVEITPYHPTAVPYKLEPPTEKPELELGFTTDAPDDPPFWQTDSLPPIPIKYNYVRHHLSSIAKSDSTKVKRKKRK